MKKAYLINDLVWICVAFFVCLGGLRLGFGTFRQPHAGFMPFICGLLLGILALADLILGLIGQWQAEKTDKEIWAEVNWKKMISTLVVLFSYIAFFNTLGFFIETILLLLFLLRLMAPRPWWINFIISTVITSLCYLGFKVGLESQLPRGPLGF